MSISLSPENRQINRRSRDDRDQECDQNDETRGRVRIRLPYIFGWQPTLDPRHLSFCCSLRQFVFSLIDLELLGPDFTIFTRRRRQGRFRVGNNVIDLRSLSQIFQSRLSFGSHFCGPIIPGSLLGAGGPALRQPIAAVITKSRIRSNVDTAFAASFLSRPRFRHGLHVGEHLFLFTEIPR